MSAIVKVDSRHYRIIAQEHWGLTDEQMKGMHVHHRIPQSKGGSDDPSNLFVCSPWFHAHAWHGEDSCHPLVEWCAKAGKKGGKAGRGRPKPPRPQSVKDKIRESNRPGVSRPNNNGPILREAHRRKSPEQLKRESEKKRKAHLGVSLSEQHCKAIGDGHRGKPKPRVTCPHCGKVGGNNVMNRWHFDNCKHQVH